MKTAKKILSVIMTVVMVLSAFSAVSFAAAGCIHDPNDDNTTLRVYNRIPATCSAKGKVYYECTNCTFTTTAELKIDPDYHIYGNWTVTVEPTCADAGEKIRYCTGENCTAYETGTVPATGAHVYADESELDFWWTVEGIKVGDTYKSWKIASIPTCFDKGSATTKCTKCGVAEKTADLMAHSNSFVVDSSRGVAANCTSKGKCYVVCSVCNANYTLDTPIDATNHLWTYEVTKEPTCTEDGLKTGVCHLHYDAPDAPTKVIPATGHTFTTYKYCKDATCQSDGTEKAICENCDAEDVRTAVGTKYDCVKTWIFRDKGNCVDGGVADLICLDCKTVYQTKTFAAGVHPEIRKVTYAPTCIKDGHEDTVCSVCGIINSKNLDKTGHNEKKVNKTMPNCMSKTDRVDLLICQTCGNIREEVTPYTHRLVNVTPGIEATCTKAGKTAHNKCLECSYQELPEIIEAFGHRDTDNDGCCNICYVYFVENSEGEVVDCKCLCHNPDGIAKLFFKFYNFFCKLFGTNQVCNCGKLHYEKAGIN